MPDRPNSSKNNIKVKATTETEISKSISQGLEEQLEIKKDASSLILHTRVTTSSSLSSSESRYSLEVDTPSNLANKSFPITSPLLNQNTAINKFERKPISSGASQYTDAFLSCCTSRSSVSDSDQEQDSITETIKTIENQLDSILQEIGIFKPLEIDNMTKSTAKPDIPTPIESNDHEEKTDNAEKCIQVETDKYDVLSKHMYDGVKAVWGYGCGIAIAKPFLKATEGVAGKILNMTTGIQLERSEDDIKPKLAELDQKFVNPAISRLLQVLEPVIGKADDTLRPIIALLLRKLHYITFYSDMEINPSNNDEPIIIPI